MAGIDYSTPDEEQQPQQPKNAATGYQWNAGNAFNSWDLNPLAQQIGGGADGVRDTLAAGRDAYLQPLMAQYRQQMAASGQRADEGDQNLFNNQDFRAFAQTGQLPASAPPTAQWTSSSSTSPNPANTDRQNKLFDELWTRIQSPITPGADDPTIRRQADAFSAQQTRASRDYLGDMAEKGGPYMNMTGEQRLAAERAGANSAQYEAGLIGDEQDKRRAAVQQDLGLYGNLLSDQQKTDLQQELGLRGLDEQTASRLMQNDQFLRQLALTQWNLGDQSNQWWSAFGTGAGQ